MIPFVKFPVLDSVSNVKPFQDMGNLQTLQLFHVQTAVVKKIARYVLNTSIFYINRSVGIKMIV